MPPFSTRRLIAPFNHITRHQLAALTFLYSGLQHIHGIPNRYSPILSLSLYSTTLNKSHTTNRAIARPLRPPAPCEYSIIQLMRPDLGRTPSLQHFNLIHTVQWVPNHPSLQLVPLSHFHFFYLRYDTSLLRPTPAKSVRLLKDVRFFPPTPLLYLYCAKASVVPKTNRCAISCYRRNAAPLRELYIAARPILCVRKRTWYVFVF